MEFSFSNIKEHLTEFVRRANLEAFFNAQRVGQAAAVAERALVQWPNQMTQTLPDISVDWKQFDYSVARLALYDILLQSS